LLPVATHGHDPSYKLKSQRQELKKEVICHIWKTKRTIIQFSDQIGPKSLGAKVHSYNFHVAGFNLSNWHVTAQLPWTSMFLASTSGAANAI
jgi:hypothetical protein